MSDVRALTKSMGERKSLPRGVEQEEENVYRNEDLVHSVAQLIGSFVDVQVANGSVYAGILKTISPRLEFGLEAVHLKQCAENCSEVNETATKEQLLPRVVFHPTDILCLTANVNPKELLQLEKFKTDTKISQCNGTPLDRELERWHDESSELASQSSNSLDASTHSDGWKAEAMFETNEKKFNVQTSYDKEMLEYTTELKQDDTEEFRQRVQRADLLVREMKGEETCENDDDDTRTEEERFSAVQPVRQQQIQSTKQNADHSLTTSSTETNTKTTDHSHDSETETKLLEATNESENTDGDKWPSDGETSSQSSQRNQAARTGTSTRQPQMPPIPEDNTTEGKLQKSKMMKEFDSLRSFSSNFLLDANKTENASAQTSESNVVSDEVSASTLNPEAKAFMPAFEMKPNSHISHAPVHSPVYSPVNSPLQLAPTPVHHVQQPHSQVIGSVIYPPSQSVPVAMSQYLPHPMPPSMPHQMRGMHRQHIPHIQMQHEMSGSPGMSVQTPVYINHSPPVAYSPGTQVMTMPAHGHPQMTYVPVGTPEMQPPVILMQQHPSYPQPAYGQPMPGPPVQSPSMMPAPYVINPQPLHYNTPASPGHHMHMHFPAQLHPLAAQSPGPVDHRTSHQNRHGPSPPLMSQHVSQAIPIPGRNHYQLSMGSQGPMGQ